MGFDIDANRDPKKRFILTERDREYVKNCRTCAQATICGGWSVWNDARNCDGPGEVCFDGCRAICSRSPEKVDVMARMMGDFVVGPDGRATPNLSIVGNHPWHRWSMEWPDVGFQLNAHASGVYEPLFTVSLKHLYYPARDSWSPQRNLRERFQIHPNARLGITTTCHDYILDALQGQLDKAAEKLAMYEGVDFIIAPNFSVYDNFPRLDNLFRIKWKWVALEKLQKAGMRVVPDICAVNSADLNNHVAWMRDNHCDVMLVNFQVQAVTTETREWMGQVRVAQAIRDKLGWPVQLIAYGAAGGDRVRSIVDLYGPTVTFIDGKSYRLAEFHKTIDEVVNRELAPKDLFHHNCRMRRERVAIAKGRAAFPTLESDAAVPLTDLHERPVRGTMTSEEQTSED